MREKINRTDIRYRRRDSFEIGNREVTSTVAGRKTVSDEENEIVFEIGNKYDSDDLRARILKRKQTIDENYIQLAYDLFLVKHNHWYRKWDYESFDRYIISELDMAQSTAMELIRVWKKFKKDLSLQDEEIHGLGYQKAKLLRHVINPSNAGEWIERAKQVKCNELEADIRVWNEKNPKLDPIEDRTPEAMKALEASKNTDFSSPSAIANLPKSDRPIKKTFFLYPSQLELVNLVVNEEQTKTDSLKQGHNLVSALTELLVARGQFGDKDEKKPLTILALFESAFGGKVVWFKSDEQIKLIEQIMRDNPNSFEKEGSNVKLGE